ncbi:LysR family transcriptional regulator [Pseudomonas sp. L-22-4S-12]|uniref:LysR family transcriptional regulator n=1 Tax=Pseudomonas sp. L-22-4S-12 TaxID=2610893 RepID=UPI00132918AA|nr:LysR family transcriptional regulator [Pseudomonas sp. L-22-4S-12]MWV17005.1 LysR family transcriptional regulator [Pseudomonas sp. L-22-4S-12]
MDRQQQMQVFLAVSQTLSLAAAARQLELSAPTVTRAIDALEARLNLTLLQRSTRGVLLTEAGERFAADCQRILAEVLEAEASASGLHSQPRGHLTVSVPLLFGQELMPAILLDYLQQYPEVQLYVRYLDRQPNLHEEGVDVAILAGALPDSSLFALKAGQIRRVVCASPAYLSRRGTPQHPNELGDHQIIHSSADARLTEWRFQVDGSQRHYPLRPRLSCTTNQAAIRAACADGGLTRCMSYQVHERLQRGELVEVLQGFGLPELPVHVVYREGRRAAARVRSFVDFAVGRLREHPALA